MNLRKTLASILLATSVSAQAQEIPVVRANPSKVIVETGTFAQVAPLPITPPAPPVVEEPAPVHNSWKAIASVSHTNLESAAYKPIEQSLYEISLRYPFTTFEGELSLIGQDVTLKQDLSQNRANLQAGLGLSLMFPTESNAYFLGFKFLQNPEAIALNKNNEEFTLEGALKLGKPFSVEMGGELKKTLDIPEFSLEAIRKSFGGNLKIGAGYQLANGNLEFKGMVAYGRNQFLDTEFFSLDPIIAYTIDRFSIVAEAYLGTRVGLAGNCVVYPLENIGLGLGLDANKQGNDQIVTVKAAIIVRK